MTTAQLTTRRKLFRVPEMEGPVARWYAKNRGSESQLAQYRAEAARLVADLPDGARILEVAPGPGYHAVELARSGRFHVTGLDISRTMVEIANEYAQREGVTVDFQHGDACAMSYPANTFDLIVCQAAFKNFLEPVAALNEMHRVLKPGGVAVIQDLRKEATRAEIRDEVAGMQLSGFQAAATRLALSMLRRRARSRAQFEQLAAQSAFGGCDITGKGVGMEVRLTKAS